MYGTLTKTPRPILPIYAETTLIHANNPAHAKHPLSDDILIGLVECWSGSECVVKMVKGKYFVRGEIYSPEIQNVHFAPRDQDMKERGEPADLTSQP
jgi:hypothetical protein